MENDKNLWQVIGLPVKANASLSVSERSAAYQLVGEVMAHQGDDG